MWKIVHICAATWSSGEKNITSGSKFPGKSCYDTQQMFSLVVDLSCYLHKQYSDYLKSN